MDKVPMGYAITYTLRRLEEELKIQGIKKREFAKLVGKKEHWLHGVFAQRQRLLAEDLLAMTIILRISCDSLLPPSIARELKTLTFEEWMDQFIERKLAGLLSRAGGRGRSPKKRRGGH